jgi:hypothetical protein
MNEIILILSLVVYHMKSYFRHRSCTNPVPNARGDYCRGFYSQSESCNLQPCTGNYYWLTKRLRIMENTVPDD